MTAQVVSPPSMVVALVQALSTLTLGLAHVPQALSPRPRPSAEVIRHPRQRLDTRPRLLSSTSEPATLPAHSLVLLRHPFHPARQTCSGRQARQAPTTARLHRASRRLRPRLPGTILPHLQPSSTRRRRHRILLQAPRATALLLLLSRQPRRRTLRHRHPGHRPHRMLTLQRVRHSTGLQDSRCRQRAPAIPQLRLHSRLGLLAVARLGEVEINSMSCLFAYLISSTNFLVSSSPTSPTND